ncbi:glycine-rich RNA-binding protein [Histoplasma capsulatum var. duboisii H88]|uniref:Glycine-rich RNA-binding protein n=1 Tax=Ajellomyces capsulatus (strain H88) TaxID=544711 RepID=A0A8A1LW62_AJEC8|nr:glycine-rich RNA-binding protein [Histoplasma capsulatum var. duboisii H88]
MAVSSGSTKPLIVPLLPATKVATMGVATGITVSRAAVEAVTAAVAAMVEGIAIAKVAEAVAGVAINNNLMAAPMVREVLGHRYRRSSARIRRQQSFLELMSNKPLLPRDASHPHTKSLHINFFKMSTIKDVREHETAINEPRSKRLKESRDIMELVPLDSLFFYLIISLGSFIPLYTM